MFETQEKPSLQLLLQRLQAMDDDLIEFDPEAHKMTFEDLKEKIDSIVQVKNNLESRLAYHKERMKEHKDISDSITNSLVRLKEWVQYCLKIGGMEKVIGNNSYVQVTKNKRLELFYSDNQIDSDIFAKYPDAIKRSFVWDKVHIKENIDKYTEIAKIEPTTSVKFGVKK